MSLRAAATAARDAAPLRCCAQPPIVWPQRSGASEMHTPPSPQKIAFHTIAGARLRKLHIRLFHGAPLSCKNLPSHNSRTFSAPLQVTMKDGLSTPLLPDRGKKRHALPHTGRRAPAHPRVLFRHLGLRNPHPFVRGVFGLALAAAIVCVTFVRPSHAQRFDHVVPRFCVRPRLTPCASASVSMTSTPPSSAGASSALLSTVY